MKEELMQQVVPAVASIVGLVISWAVLTLKGKLSSLLASHVSNTQVRGALDLANDVVSTVVLELNQTMRAKFEAAAADGTITAEEAGKLKDEAVSRAKALLGEEGLRRLKGALGGIDLGTLLAAKVEAKVAETKLPPFFASPEMSKRMLEAARQ